MVEEPDVAMASERAGVRTAVGVRLSVSPLVGSAIDRAHDAGAAAEPVDIGPRFVGQVAVASGNELVLIGHVADGELQVWRGSADALTLWTQFSAAVPAGGLVAVVRYRDRWHLFARNERGGSTHLVSADLTDWATQHHLSAGFPSFAVSGATVRNGELLLVGRVFVDTTAFGWGVLRSDGRAFDAQPVPLPLATQLCVIGPIVNRQGDTVLLLDSGHNRTVARATGTSWTLCPLVPNLTPTAAFVRDLDTWLVGRDSTGVTSMAKIDDALVVPVPTNGRGRVRSALVHGDHLVLACEC